MDTIMPIIAWIVVGALFTIPGIWFSVFATSLLAHLIQFLPEQNKKEDQKK